MRRFVWMSVSILVIAVSSIVPTSAYQATPQATPFACPITQPNTGGPAPNEAPTPGGYRNDALWTNVWMWGKAGVILAPGDGHITDEGAFIGLKWAWWRYKPGMLTITGQRLDAQAPPLEAWVPDGYGENGGFQVSGITFPTMGCWEVTGHLGDDSLTFVVWVAVGQPNW